MIAELAQVSQPKLGAPVVYHDPTFKLTLSAPTGWIFDRHEAEEAKGESKIFMIDPDGIATTMLGAKSLAALVGAVLTVCVIMPAEYRKDPTGFGKLTGDLFPCLSTARMPKKKLSLERSFMV